VSLHWWLGPLYDPPAAFVVTTLTTLALADAWLSFRSLAVPERAALLVPLLT
jgi:hypothetical protein